MRPAFWQVHGSKAVCTGVGPRWRGSKLHDFRTSGAWMAPCSEAFQVEAPPAQSGVETTRKTLGSRCRRRGDQSKGAL